MLILVTKSSTVSTLREAEIKSLYLLSDKNSHPASRLSHM